MQWNQDGGFSTKKPWLKMNENMKFINVFDSIQNSDSILNHYKELISIRKENDVLINGSFEPLYTKSGLFVFKRYHSKSSIICVSNLTKKAKKMPIKISGKILLSNYKRENLSDQILKPYESILVMEE